MSDLKPCPFCGGEATVEYYDGARVSCDDCLALIAETYSSEEEAIAAWNRRAEPTLVPDQASSRDQEAMVRTGVELIAAERARQVTEEGWTEAHDDDHDDESLALVATLYALPPSYKIRRGPMCLDLVGLLWPSTWDRKWWNPKNRIQDLVRAGALIAAEIDRLQRAGAREEPDHD